MTWQNAQTTLQLKWSSLHIDETPHDLFSSILFMQPTILNVVKHGKRVKQRKLPIQSSLNEAGNDKTTSPETPHMHILGLVLLCPKHNFRVIKHAK